MINDTLQWKEMIMFIKLHMHTYMYKHYSHAILNCIINEKYGKYVGKFQLMKSTVNMQVNINYWKVR